ncbi:MAG TPA: hypothetical protein VIQ97_03135 [Prevotella sp.]
MALPTTSPATECRSHTEGTVHGTLCGGYYWTAIPHDKSQGCNGSGKTIVIADTNGQIMTISAQEVAKSD